MPIPLLSPLQIVRLCPGIRPDSPPVSQTEPRAEGICEDRRTETTGEGVRETGGDEFHEEIVDRAERSPDAEAPEDLLRGMIREVVSDKV